MESASETSLNPDISLTVELLPICGEAAEQGGRFPQSGAVRLLEFFDAGENFVEAYGIGIEHGTAAPCGETVAVEVDDIDIHGAKGNTFFDNARAFVDQSIEA